MLKKNMPKKEDSIIECSIQFKPKSKNIKGNLGSEGKFVPLKSQSVMKEATSVKSKKIKELIESKVPLKKSQHMKGSRKHKDLVKFKTKNTKRAENAKGESKYSTFRESVLKKSTPEGRKIKKGKVSGPINTNFKAGDIYIKPSDEIKDSLQYDDSISSFASSSNVSIPCYDTYFNIQNNYDCALNFNAQNEFYLTTTKEENHYDTQLHQFKFQNNFGKEQPIADDFNETPLFDFQCGVPFHDFDYVQSSESLSYDSEQSVTNIFQENSMDMAEYHSTHFIKPGNFNTTSSCNAQNQFDLEIYENRNPILQSPHFNSDFNFQPLYAVTEEFTIDISDQTPLYDALMMGFELQSEALDEEFANGIKNQLNTLVEGISQNKIAEPYVFDISQEDSFIIQELLPAKKLNTSNFFISEENNQDIDKFEKQAMSKTEIKTKTDKEFMKSKIGMKRIQGKKHAKKKLFHSNTVPYEENAEINRNLELLTSNIARESSQSKNCCETKFLEETNIEEVGSKDELEDFAFKKPFIMKQGISKSINVQKSLKEWKDIFNIKGNVTDEKTKVKIQLAMSFNFSCKSFNEFILPRELQKRKFQKKYQEELERYKRILILRQGHRLQKMLKKLILKMKRGKLNLSFIRKTLEIYKASFFFSNGIIYTPLFYFLLKNFHSFSRMAFKEANKMYVWIRFHKQLHDESQDKSTYLKRYSLQVLQHNIKLKKDFAPRSSTSI